MSEKTPPGSGHAERRAAAYRAVMESAGLAFMNRAHARSFSLNILQMNGLELLEALRRVQDPQTGMRLMGETHREAGTQAHRELSRHIHNFATSANSLVDHTRVFLNEYYRDSEIQIRFVKAVTGTIARTPAIKFVHDLRHYMVHRALPDTQMFLEMRQDPNKPEAGLQTFSGIRINSASLLEYDRWTADSKRYLNDVGEYVEIDALVDEYLVAVNALQYGLDCDLEAHHAQDLAELSRLQGELHRLDAETPAMPSRPGEAASEVAGGLSASTSGRIDALAQELVDTIEQMTLTVLKSTGFTGSRPAPVITGEDVVGDPVMRREDASGRPVVVFDWKGGPWGMTQASYRRVHDLADLVRSEDWGRTGLGPDFIEEQFLNWARQKRRKETDESFSAALKSAADTAVKPFEVWAPIAHLEVETAFDFGPVQIRPINRAFLDELRAALPEPVEDRAKSAVDDYFERLERKVLGFAAVVVTVSADHDYASEQGLEIARDAVNLLRIYSPGAPFAECLCPTALLGADYVPKYEVLTRSGSDFYSQEGLIRPESAYWRISEQYLAELHKSHLDRVGALIDPRGLTPFKTSIRGALLLHSAGLASAEPHVRLRAGLDALEQVLLRHEMEPKAARVADRAGRILFDVANPMETGQRIRAAYRLRDAAPAPLSFQDDRLLGAVAWDVQMALMTVIGNSDRFLSVSDFLTAIDGPFPTPQSEF